MITVIICIIIAAAASVVQTVFYSGSPIPAFFRDWRADLRASAAVHADDPLMVTPVCDLCHGCPSPTPTSLATVTQGTLKHLRVDMFDKMQSLPIKYFDTHAHGDIASTYTNDTDAIRQLIGQSLPIVFSLLSRSPSCSSLDDLLQRLDDSVVCLFSLSC